MVNNKLITVKVDPTSIFDDEQLSQKFFPSGNSELYFYESEELVPRPDEQDEIEQFYWQDSYPSSQIYSLLKEAVKIGVDPLEDILEEDIVAGIKPNLESAMYSGQHLKNFGLRYGLIYKNEIYDLQMEKLANDMFSEIWSEDEQVVSINKQRSLQDYIFIIRGRVLQEETALTYTNDAGLEIDGIKFHSPNLYDIDYYNDTIIPYTTKTTANRETGLVSQVNPEISMPEEPPPPEEQTLLTSIVSEDVYSYVYEGADPLPSMITKTMTFTIPHGINKEGYRLFAWHDGGSNNISFITIVNKTDSSPSPDSPTPVDSTAGGQTYSQTDITSFGYSLYNYEADEGAKSVDFYRTRTTNNYRTEDAIQVENGEITATYLCSKGLGNFDALVRLCTMGNLAKTSSAIAKEEYGVLPEEYANYEIQLGGKLWNLLDVHASADNSRLQGAGRFKNMGCFDVTDLFNATLTQTQSSTSMQTHVPIGRNKSATTITSTKLTDLSQNSDTKNALGGALQYKTEVYPDSIVRVILGDTGLIKNINVEGTFATAGELDIVASNFYQNNKLLNTITITCKGFIDPSEDVGTLLNVSEYLVDKVTYDYASNGSVIILKAIID